MSSCVGILVVLFAVYVLVRVVKYVTAQAAERKAAAAREIQAAEQAKRSEEYRKVQEKQRAEEAERQRQEAAKAAQAAAARMAEMETWPIERLKYEVEDVRSQMQAKKREYDSLEIECNRALDRVADEQREWQDRGGYLSDDGCPDSNTTARYWEQRHLTPARQELEHLERRYAELKEVLDRKWR